MTAAVVWYAVEHLKASGQVLHGGVATFDKDAAMGMLARRARSRAFHPGGVYPQADGSVVIDGLFGKERLYLVELSREQALARNRDVERETRRRADEAWRDVWAAECALGLRTDDGPDPPS